MQTTAVVIGAGHAGLAMSRRLTERSIDHVVLERGEVANSWRTQRWPSLRLLTPNWQTRLPGHDYAGDDPDGYMPVAGVDPLTPLELDLTSGEVTTVLWATGFRPDHSWLDIPVRDRTGRIRHDGGVVTSAPGLYLLGMPVLRTRASTYIHGAAADSDALAGHLHSFLSSRHR